MTVKTSLRGSAEVERVSETAYSIKRRFHARPDAVFRALTEPEFIQRWWGHEEAEWLDCRVDLRVGGYWRFSAKGPGYVVSFHGRYQEVGRPHRLVHTEIYEGLPGGGPEVDEPLTLISTDITEENGASLLFAHVECYSAEVLEAVFASGMEGGLQVSYDRLEELLPELS